MLADFKYALRSLLRTPGFTIVAITTLAFGIGATVAIFSLVNAVLLRPLPYGEPQSLVCIYSEYPTMGSGLTRLGMSAPEYLDIRNEAKAWESIEAWRVTGANLVVSDVPQRTTIAYVTGGIFNTLRVAPALGRLLTPEDDKPGVAPVAVISHELWQQVFGEARDVLNRNVLLDGRRHTIVGVMPKQFTFPPREAEVPKIWVPLQINPAEQSDRHLHTLKALGRLKPGGTVVQAQAEFNALVEQWGKTFGAEHFFPKFHTIVIHPLHEEAVRTVRPALQMLFGAVCFLLLIACVNVANLLLARTEGRQREIAIRGALGANVWQLARQFFAEGLLLACAGAAIGLLLAVGALALIKSIVVVDIAPILNNSIDTRVLWFALAAAVLAGGIAAVAPLMHVLKQNLHDSMRAGSASTGDAVSTQRFRQVLVVCQLALALMLLIGTGLMLRTSWKLQEVSPGFNSQGLVTMSAALPNTTYTVESARNFWRGLEERLQALPGVKNIALASELPPIQSGTYAAVEVEGRPATLEKPPETADFYQVVSQDYFRTLQIPLISGRLFDQRDDAKSSAAVIISQTAARRFWGNENPVGRRLNLYRSQGWYTVVGVVADVKNDGVAKSTGTAIYVPYQQALHNTFIMELFIRHIEIVVPYKNNPAPTVEAVRRELNRMDPLLPLMLVRTMDEVVEQAQARPRFLSSVLTLFAGIALTLAAIGVYGVIAFAVAQRTREFGLRTALGAEPEQVLLLVLRQGLLLTICGLAIGLLGSFAATQLLSGFLFGIKPTDPMTFFSVSMLLAVIALLASYIPARRATQVDPLVALRTE
jgi:putative ABC transport system permease protein